MAGRGPRYGVRIDYIAEALIAIFVLVILFAGLGGLIGNDQASFNLAVFMVLMQVSAVSLWVVSKTYQVQSNVSGADFAKDSKLLVAGLATFFILNWVVPLTLPFVGTFHFTVQSLVRGSLASGPKFVTIMMSIPEESLFRGWAAPWFARKVGLFGGAFLQAAAFAIYHLFVYGTNPSSLVIVFLAGFIAGLIVLKSQRLYVTMAMHFTANAIASGVFS